MGFYSQAMEMVAQMGQINVYLNIDWTHVTVSYGGTDHSTFAAGPEQDWKKNQESPDDTSVKIIATFPCNRSKHLNYVATCDSPSCNSPRPEFVLHKVVWAFCKPIKVPLSHAHIIPPLSTQSEPYWWHHWYHSCIQPISVWEDCHKYKWYSYSTTLVPKVI